MRKFLVDATRMTFPEVTEVEVANAVANWLRHAKERREHEKKRSKKVLKFYFNVYIQMYSV